MRRTMGLERSVTPSSHATVFLDRVSNLRVHQRQLGQSAGPTTLERPGHHVARCVIRLPRLDAGVCVTASRAPVASVRFAQKCPGPDIQPIARQPQWR